jgi:hypothetical protein
VFGGKTWNRPVSIGVGNGFPRLGGLSTGSFCLQDHGTVHLAGNSGWEKGERIGRRQSGLSGFGLVIELGQLACTPGKRRHEQTLWITLGLAVSLR